MKKKFSWGYALLKLLVWPGARLYYRQFSVHGLENFPKKDQPTILISNHQNGMMDAIMLCITAPRQLHFLTRADIFKNPRMSRLLKSLNMLPVYRPRDKVENLVDENAATFDEAHRRIANGNLIALFPEGNHNNQKWLRPFRKGISRVSIGALESVNFESDVFIVPVGLDYSNYTDFQSDLLLNFGPPISTLQFAEAYQTEPAKTLSMISKLAFEGLQEQVLNIQEKEHYGLIKKLLPLFVISSCNGRMPKKHIERLRKSQQGVRDIQSIIHSPTGPDFLKDAKLYLKLVDQLKVDIGLLNTRSSVLREIARFLSIPVLFIPIIVGVILNFIPAFLVTSFVRKKVKDPHFISSITLGLGVFIFPIFWLFAGLLAWLFTSSLTVTIVTLLAAPVCGTIAARVWKSQQKVTKLAKMHKTRKKHEKQFAEMMQLNTRLIAMFNKRENRH